MVDDETVLAEEPLEPLLVNPVPVRWWWSERGERGLGLLSSSSLL